MRLQTSTQLMTLGNSILVRALFVAFTALALPLTDCAATPPKILGPARTGGSVHDSRFRSEGSWLKLGEGKFVSVGMNTNDGKVFVQHASGYDQPWQPDVPANLLWATKVAQDRDGRLHAMWLVMRGKGTPAVDRFIDIWYARTSGADGQWEAAHRIWEGYVGAICGRITQLKSGRIILPFARWLPEERRGPPRGCNASTVIYSDDAGKTWKESASRLFAPCPENYNGDPVGAVEPVVLELNDGRVWMLMRTQAGVLYESFSRDGVDWSPAQPTKFPSSTGPPELVRLPDGRIVMFWNHCELPPRFENQGVYGGRDALHAAISSNEGKTWRGFREVYLDPTRHNSPPKRGDRGTAYPQFKHMQNGKMFFASGQGETLRVLIELDPDWLEETSRADDFSDGLTNWSTFKPFGPAKGWWRDRVRGSALVEHPAKPGQSVLRIAKPDEKDADGAMWNFPAGRGGKVTACIRINQGFRGATISLLDHFFDPTDEAGEKHATCSVNIAADGKVNGKGAVKNGEFCEVAISWDLEKRTANVTVDGADAGAIPLLGNPPHGLSYLRFRSAAKEKDTAGLLIESVKAEVRP